jgi:hypothetical protein
MASKARPKYKCKNIHEYKIIRRCTYKEGCSEYGIVSYRNDPPSGVVKHEYRCPGHVKKEREKKNTTENTTTDNAYRTLYDPGSLLDLTTYFARG